MSQQTARTRRGASTGTTGAVVEHLSYSLNEAAGAITTTAVLAEGSGGASLTVTVKNLAQCAGIAKTGTAIQITDVAGSLGTPNAPGFEFSPVEVFPDLDLSTCVLLVQVWLDTSDCTENESGVFLLVTGASGQSVSPQVGGGMQYSGGQLQIYNDRLPGSSPEAVVGSGFTAYLAHRIAWPAVETVFASTALTGPLDTSGTRYKRSRWSTNGADSQETPPAATNVRIGVYGNRSFTATPTILVKQIDLWLLPLADA